MITSTRSATPIRTLSTCIGAGNGFGATEVAAPVTVQQGERT
jgi:hypothetical protein